ncbi:hypothetical protein DK52_3270 [Brucella abortus]|nr:hypothetical protein DK52_3270 [Brucella abortus]
MLKACKFIIDLLQPGRRDKVAMRTDGTLAQIGRCVVLFFGKSSAHTKNVREAIPAYKPAGQPICAVPNTAAGVTLPRGMPFQFFISGLAKSASFADKASSLRKRRDRTAATIASEARVAPSSHFIAKPKPSSGTEPQNTPSAPVFTKMRPGAMRISSVHARLVPAT